MKCVPFSSRCFSLFFSALCLVSKRLLNFSEKKKSKRFNNFISLLKKNTNIINNVKLIIIEIILRRGKVDT